MLQRREARRLPFASAITGASASSVSAAAALAESTAAASGRKGAAGGNSPAGATSRPLITQKMSPPVSLIVRSSVPLPSVSWTPSSTTDVNILADVLGTIATVPSSCVMRMLSRALVESPT